MLRELLQSPAVRSSPLADAPYRPRVTRHDRGLWTQPDAIRQYWTSRGERYLTFPWPELTAEMYGEFRETGRRSGRAGYEATYLRRRQIVCTLALAEGYENEGRFLPRLVDAVSGLCDEQTWVLPAHENDAIDIFATETINLLAWVIHLFGDTSSFVDSGVIPRARQAIDDRVIRPYLERDDFWWMALNGEAPGNWTTWCSSNCAATAMLLEEDLQRRWQVLDKTCRSLDRFLAVHAEDGACDEGPMYWNFAAGCLFDFLELMHDASGGAFDMFAEPVIGRLGRFISAVHIRDLRFVSFADSLPQVPIDAALLYRYGRRIGDAHMQALGAHIHRLLDRYDVEDTLRLKLSRAIATLPDTAALASLPGPDSAARESYLPRLEMMVAREDARPDRGFVVAAQGGRNAGGHNHNDVGNVAVYLDGEPVLIDVGVKEYSRDSFTDRRYDIWAMQSAWHNVPLINGCVQSYGVEYTARHARFTANEDAARFDSDIGAAYPADAGVVRWQRACSLLRRERRITIEDAVDFSGDVNRYELRFLTAYPPRIDRDGVVIALAAECQVLLQVEPRPDRVVLCTCPLGDPRLTQVWGRTLYQIRFGFDGVPRTARAVTSISRREPAQNLAAAAPATLESIELP